MLTDEQQAVVEATLRKEPHIAVNAVAGSGKTSTCKGIVEAYRPKNGLYTAFNKAIVEDSKRRFGDKIPCKTIHALAYAAFRPTKVQDLSYQDIVEDIPYDEKIEVIQTLEGYFNSSEPGLSNYLKDQKELEPRTKNLVEKYVNKMLDKKIPPTFDFLLKYMHYSMASGNYRVHRDLVLIDECQDIVPVTLEIYKLIDADVKVMLGDTHQNIYSFMNTVNAFRKWPTDHNYRLTQSFRCTPGIAAIVEQFGTSHLSSDFRFKGTDIVAQDGTEAYLTRTNAALIKVMHMLIEDGKTFKVVRPLGEIFGLPIALLNATSGKEVYDRRYAYLVKERKKWAKLESMKGKDEKPQSFWEYLSEILSEDYPLMAAIKVLNMLSLLKVSIYDIKKTVELMKPNPNILLSTAHSFKGLEANTVYINEDLNKALLRGLKAQEQDDDETATEEFNTYYVALSRARRELYGHIQED